MSETELPDDKTEMLPDGCGYQGYEFGGGYLESQCFGGKLYDMDNCDDNGLIYEPSRDIPCPVCRRNDAISYYASVRAENFDEPTPKDIAGATLLVDDIRKNRGITDANKTNI